MRKCSTSVAIKETEVKTTVRFHLTLLEWSYSRANTTTKAGKDVKPLYTAGGNANNYNHYGKPYGNSSKS
jgi:hypothetical protein